MSTTCSTCHRERGLAAGHCAAAALPRAHMECLQRALEAALARSSRLEHAIRQHAATMYGSTHRPQAHPTDALLYEEATK